MNNTFSPSGVYIRPRTAEEVNELRRIRRETATAILAGLAANSSISHSTSYPTLANWAVEMADTLLRKLDA